MSFDSFDELVAQLRNLHKQGYIATHRRGNTGVGKTLEDQLGIQENNDETADIQIPPSRKIELKSIRDDADSRITLFCKEPPQRERRIWGSEAIEQFGYDDPTENRRALYTTMEFGTPNPQGLYLTYQNDRLAVAHAEYGICAYYPQSTLRSKIEKKFPELVLVTAETKGDGGRELFWYSGAQHLTGFDPETFFSLIEQGEVVLDTRMHLSETPNRTYRNHGTAWRVEKQHLPKIFSQTTELLTGDESQASVDVRAYGQQFLHDYV